MGEPSIAIVGGGCSGVLVAAHVLARLPGAELTIVEPRQELGRGVAYSTPWRQHLLNVPAGQMSAFAARPSHLVEWMARNALHGGPTAFIPRNLYGQYLQDVLDEAISRTLGKGSVRHLRGEVVDLDLRGHCLDLSMSDGSVLSASSAVLALGNPAPAGLPGIPTANADPRIFGSAWDAEALRLTSAGERVLVVGSGLTAIDALLAFQAQGHTGPLHLVSRRGRLPQGHALRAREAVPRPRRLEGALRDVYRSTREGVGAAQDWRDVVDALRPVTNALWQSWRPQERSRFVRHVKAHWDTHRHRMAPEISATLERCEQSGRLFVHAGRVRGLSGSSAGLQVDLVTRAQATVTVEVDRVINCTGIAEKYSGSRRPLIRALLAKELARANELGTGFSTDADGALVDGSGHVSDRLFTIGPPRYGDLLETIAVPEIRVQAERLAARLVTAPAAIETEEVTHP